jgi:hypothetical protein
MVDPTDVLVVVEVGVWKRIQGRVFHHMLHLEIALAYRHDEMRVPRSRPFLIHGVLFL